MCRLAWMQFGGSKPSSSSGWRSRPSWAAHRWAWEKRILGVLFWFLPFCFCCFSFYWICVMFLFFDFLFDVFEFWTFCVFVISCVFHGFCLSILFICFFQLFVFWSSCIFSFNFLNCFWIQVLSFCLNCWIDFLQVCLIFRLSLEIVFVFVFDMIATFRSSHARSSPGFFNDLTKLHT